MLISILSRHFLHDLPFVPKTLPLVPIFEGYGVQNKQKQRTAMFRMFALRLTGRNRKKEGNRKVAFNLILQL